MKTNGHNRINRAFKAFRKDPCIANRNKLAEVLLGQCTTDVEHEIAGPIAAKIVGGASTRSEIHRDLVSAASATGVDLGTLSGGVTPED